MSAEKVGGVDVLKVIKDSRIQKVDESMFVKTSGINYKNGTIEVLLPLLELEKQLTERRY